MDWKITDGSFKGFKFHVATPRKENFGMLSQEVTDERRLQVSERALVDGADVEDFGAKPRVFTADIIFFGEDYQAQIKAFRKVLDEGTTGVLVLPDLDEAVFAKFQKSVRKTAAETATMLSISWLEDRTRVIQATDATTAAQAQAALQAGNTAQALPTVQEQSAKVLNKSDSALSALSNNAFVKALQAAENSVVNVRTTINSALNVPRVTRQNILNTVARVTTEINGLKSAVNGLLNYTDLLTLGLSFTSPSRINSGLGKVDFTAVEEATTATVVGNQTVVTEQEQVKNIQSFAEAVKDLKNAQAAVLDAKNELETETGGNTQSFSQEAVALANTINDLVFIIEEKPTVQVFASIRQSLAEICHNNGLPVDDMDRVYRLNTNLTDILDVPAFTVVNL